MGGEGGSMAASSGSTTTAFHNPKWSEWTKAWIIFKKDSITGRRINGRINERRIKVWADGRWQMMGEYATDKELFEGTLKDSIPEYYV